MANESLKEKVEEARRNQGTVYQKKIPSGFRKTYASSVYSEILSLKIHVENKWTLDRNPRVGN